MTTSAAEFQILPSGFLQATLLKDGKRLTLDEPEVGSSGGSDSIVHEGKELDFVPDFSTSEGCGKHWQAGSWETSGDSGASAGAGGSRRSSARWWWKCMTIFRKLPWSVQTYKNVGTNDFQIDQVLDAAAPLQCERAGCEGTAAAL